MGEHTLNSSLKNKISSIYRYAGFAALVWTIIVVALSWWIIANERGHIYDLAENDARLSFNKDQAFRLWATKHGGVYVPISEHTPPNKYLAHIPERNIKTPSGRKLTLMNPAYMVRQMTDDFEGLYGVPGKITSLKVLNPINEPDNWERKVLKLFESGVKEVLEFDNINEQQYLRLMRPMLTESGCLKCHAFQGYKVGEVRGGVGISIPFAPYQAVIKDKLTKVISTHAGIWGLGLMGLGIVTYRSKKRNIEKWKAEEQKDRFINIINESNNETYIFDANTFYFVYANKGAQRNLGYTMEELQLKTIFDIQPEYNITRFKEIVTPLLRGDVANVDFETNNLKKDGTRYPVEVRIHTTQSEKILLYVAIAFDITERKEADEIINTYEHLIHSEKLTALGKLTGSIAHEFNNPLFGVTSILEQIESSESLSKEYNELLELAIKECYRMSNLVVKLRDFYRPSSGHEEEIDVHQILNDMILLMDKRLKTRNIVIEKHYSQYVPKIRGIGDRIKQVVLNIIQNAEEAITTESGKIYIYTDASDSKVFIRIKDTGEGISDNDLKNIFNPFFTTKGHKGTGLGLSVCYGIIKDCGGGLNVESELGNGTSFILDLPIKGKGNSNEKKVHSAN